MKELSSNGIGSAVGCVGGGESVDGDESTLRRLGSDSEPLAGTKNQHTDNKTFQRLFFFFLLTMNERVPSPSSTPESDRECEE